VSDDVSLVVFGNRYRGWERVRVSRSMETIASSFEMAVTDRWAERNEPWPIGEGDECKVYVGGARPENQVIAGFIDTRELEIGPGTSSTVVTGRDASGDLVDCSALLDAWEFKNVSPFDLAKKICAPYDVGVSMQPGLALPEITAPSKGKLSIDPGDTAFSALEKICRLAGVLLIPDRQGNIVISRAASTRCATQIVEGKNLIKGKATYSTQKRFHRYLVLGQHKGSDSFHGSNSAGVKGSSTDQNVERRARTLVVIPEVPLTNDQAKRRAEWECASRSARADTATVTVQGWTQQDGSLWDINTLVKVKSPTLKIDGELLISSVVYSLSREGGTTVELSLKNPGAFDTVPTIKPAGGNGYWKEVVRGV
jgi:prophage tail gpP-like protein